MGCLLIGFWVCVGRDPGALGIIVSGLDPGTDAHMTANLSSKLKSDARLSSLDDAGE